jgi:GNAT superfamily N-acetyltransferase
MHSWFRSVLAILIFSLPLAAQAGSPVAATIETSLTSADGQIRMLAFDGDPMTYFASKQNPVMGDHFTLMFDRPVAVTSIVVTTGRPSGTDQLDTGTLASSVDGKMFEVLASFADGVGHVRPKAQKIRALRLQPSRNLTHPLAIREITIESVPPVAVFKYPVEFVVDATDAPEMKDWIEKAARVCERQYQMICEELKSDGFKPRQRVAMALEKDYKGVASTSADNIVGAVRYFKAHPDDVGAMVHETVHVVQNYRGRGNPSWLVEGIADYIRFFKYEPGKVGRIDADRARYDGSYRQSATFLAYLTDQYDKELVRKINAVMREGKYKEETFKELTGKTRSRTWRRMESLARWRI